MRSWLFARRGLYLGQDGGKRPKAEADDKDNALRENRRVNGSLLPWSRDYVLDMHEARMVSQKVLSRETGPRWLGTC